MKSNNRRLSTAPLFDISKTFLLQYQSTWAPYEGEGDSIDDFKEVYSVLDFPPREPSEKPGYYLGKHYTKYVDTVKELKRAGELEKAKQLLLALIEAVEAESVANDWGVAPWYYEQLAIICRKQNDLENEIAILERFAKQKIGPGATPPKLFERLDKAKKLAKEQQQ